MIHRSIFFVAMTACFLVSPAYGQPKALTVDLANTELGTLPRGFEAARTGQGVPARWEVVADSTAKGGRALAQTSQDQTNYRFPVAVMKPVTEKNLEVSVRFKPVSGNVDQAGGIAVRLTSPDNYYVVRANALEDNVRFYRVVAGKREQLADAKVKVASGQWHTLVLKAEDARFTVSFDGKQLYTAEDRTFPEPGQIALWTKADSVTHFDSILVTLLR